MADDHDPALRLRRILMVCLGTALVVSVAFSVSFALLRYWRLPPGGQADSAALIANIPAPRLQSAPQLDRQDELVFEQRLGAQLPHPAALREADGRPVNWQALAADGRPLVLLPAFYRCDTLCGTAAHGALEALADTGLAPDSWRLLLFSVDPEDTPQAADALRNVYLQYAGYVRPEVYGGAPPDLHLLSGPATDTAELARTIGFHWQQASMAHPTGLVVLTPDGLVSHYFFGVRYEPAALRTALLEASQGHVGTLVDRLLLLCSHLDPLLAARDGEVMSLMRGVAVLVLLMLSGLVVWIRKSRR
ncbi:MAG TPA: SCO family protein [Burkholderiaceae bacterium]|jgi:protein SCO1/2